MFRHLNLAIAGVFFICFSLAGAENPKAMPFRVGAIYVVGNDTTAATAILRHAAINPGDSLSPQKARDAEGRLARSGLFAERPTITISGVGEFRDVLIQVKERRRQPEE